MEKSKYKGKGDDAAPANKFEDRFRRCTKCFVGGANYGEVKLGTMLITETVRLHVADGPNVDVAKAIRCGNAHCDNIADVVVFREGVALGVTKGAIFALLRARHAQPTFTRAELLSGRLDPFVLSPALLEAISKRTERPVFGRDYNPNEFTEGPETAAEEYPL